MIEDWMSLRTWFQEQGYFLFEVVNIGKKEPQEEYARPTRPSPDTPEHSLMVPVDFVLKDPFPYAFMGTPPSLPTEDRPPYTVTDKLYVCFSFSKHCISVNKVHHYRAQ